ncbi:carbamoyl-phosphate synthase large subunit [Limimonas halophila]|uniref:Carbamoyl phosphate synthase large chain n=1 Tax=Limimonas halophila TaxID=1082479 RepID=A0A1G7TG09_9PROT|nr:carbamoyl-phosphate synthase large subunit [Limimonas halophila]SDG34297.1 carbamoyl-phosphate synthase large subunit [Limimonas halophila]
MPKRTDIRSVLIVGAGPIIIGQACEFDYSGTQAIKALKEEGYRVVLVNSNPATIMTDPGLADATYIEPIEPATVAKVLERERPDAILPTMGGQTGLNTSLELWRDGTLSRLGVEMIGARADVIEKAEDRWQFRAAMDAVGLKSPRARIVRSYEDAMAAREHVGVPAIIRPSYTLGGTGGGIAYNDDEYEEIVRNGLRASPMHEILIEQSVLGWKEYEMEVVRDHADNCIIVCSIENIDPMGIHTGDSVTVAPTLTLTDKEYQRMRDASIACLREIGVDTGGSNVQFAIHPETGEMVVIEMNPRVSRSSALASKATGFPIAKVAAKLAVGYTLDELTNDITRVTPASFEPTIDYVVTKMPRFAFEKFRGAQASLTTSMKSVGEAMSIGRSFAESVQKALRSLETGLSGFDPVAIEGAVDEQGNVDSEAIRGALAEPVPDRLLRVAQAFRHGLSVDAVHKACRIDPWFLRQIQQLVQTEAQVAANGLPESQREMLRLKGMGFSDARLAALIGGSDADVAAHRHRLDAHPVFKRVDTCAGEFPSPTPYMYASYEGDGVNPVENEADPSERDKILILGGGPNRIGQGIEFDYCCVHACYALEAAGYETIMVNCNPETVSTDYDTADRLYFEPLTAEDVAEIGAVEQRKGRLAGAIVQFGGQTPLKLASDLEAQGIPILGTPPDAIDRAEDRERFQALLNSLGLKQPDNGLATSQEEAAREAERIGYPVLLRPSYVLGGRAMEIAHTPEDLHRYITSAVSVSGKNPVLIDSYLADAVEVDVDALSDGEDVFVAGIMEHIEEAGIHSGDSACALPPHGLSEDVVAELERQTRRLALELGVVGLMNIQFAVHGTDIFILEVNPRASRTVPFVAKAIGAPIAKVAARLMAGERLDAFKLERAKRRHVAVKEAVFPFTRFPGVDVILGPEMKSTGEVMGLDGDFARAFAKAQIGAGVKLPESGTAFISVKDRDKEAMVELSRELLALGFTIVATGGTADRLEAAELPVTRINKVREGRPHVLDSMKSGEIDLVFNTTEGAKAIADSFSLRRTALTHSIPYYTTVSGCVAATRAIQALRAGQLEVAPLQSYFEGSF